MSIKDFIEIDASYTRSINLERDIDSSTIVRAYIPTSRSLLTLRRIVHSFVPKAMPRSWALIGPYGSGKSFFSVFLAHLLDNPNNATAKAALEVCCAAETATGLEIYEHIEKSKGYLPILLTGTPEPLCQRFVASLRDAAIRFWKTFPGRPPALIDKLQEASTRKDLTIPEIQVLVEDVRAAVEAKNGKGLLIIFDELGKFLEYGARHYGGNDIYLLQALAEMAATGGKANIYVIALMHQGFEQYARGLGENLRNEWSKVQGRFENIPFLESTEQTLRIISKALITKLPELDKKVIVTECGRIAAVLAADKALPSGLDEETATQLFIQCYPLHPVTALTLPLLCQKMAQNERTLFSYLGSKEPHGLRDSLAHLQKASDWVMPWQVYEYFILNQPGVLTDPTTHRRWAEVVTAVERLGDAPLHQVELLKTIGLLNIIGAQGGFKASKNIVDLCSKSSEGVTQNATALIARSVIHFRKFSNEYRVWQGSDFDLDAAVRDERGQIGRFDLPAAINSRKPLQPIVARRYTIETGTLRYFSPVFVNLNSYHKEPRQADQQRIIFCLTESAHDLEKARQELVPYFEKLDLVALCPNGSQLRESVAEVLALHRVEQNRPELHTDPIAQREFKDRLSAAQHQEDELLLSFVEHPENAQWFWHAEKIVIRRKRDFQKKLSEIFDAIYAKSPRIKNELINRENPSAQAASARNKLVVAMVHHADKPDLGIEKFPAEKGIYRAFLQASGLHQETNDGKWQLMPPTEDNPYNIYPVWQRIDEFLETTKETPRSFAELDEILHKPPYGVKAGVLPLLYLTVFLCNQEDLAFYEDKIYTPYISDQHIERFMKRPDHFTIQRIRMHGIRASLFQQYVKVLYGEGSKQDATLLAIAKPLAKFIANLPEYTKQTNRLSDASQKARKAFELAKSPIDLLFERLPKACGYPSIDPDDGDDKKIEGFAVAFVAVIRELRDAYNKMQTEFEGLLAQALFPDVKNVMELAILRQKACSCYEDLRQYSMDVRGLRPFIEHLADRTGDDNLWFSRLLLFLGGRAAEKWSDLDRDGAVKKLEELARRLIDLRVLQNHYLRTKVNFEDGFEVIRLRSMRHGKTDYDEIVNINDSTKKYIQRNKLKFKTLLDQLDSDESRLALLADIVDEFLATKKGATEKIIKTDIEAINE